MRKYSDGYLQDLWRQSIRIKYKYTCAFCLKEIGTSGECHHIVRRKNKILRHDNRNGIYLCKDCHREAHTKLGEKRIEKIIGEKEYERLCLTERICFKDYILRNAMTETEFLYNIAEYLKSTIN